MNVASTMWNNHGEMVKALKITRSIPKIQRTDPVLVKSEKQLSDLLQLIEDENKNLKVTEA